MENRLEDSLWCGKCPKCIFVFTLLSAFLSKKELVEIFGDNLYEKAESISIFEELLGIKGHKPLECVGLPVEMIVAMRRAFEKDDYKNSKIAKYFKETVLSEFNNKGVEEELLSASNDHSVPDEFKELIKQ
jgi:hypothetical protein